MYKKLKEVLKEKGQKNEENKEYFLNISGDRKISYHEDLDILTLTEHCHENVKIKRDPRFLSYEEQLELFEELEIEPSSLLDKLKIYVNANGNETPDGLYVNLNLTPISFTGGVFNHRMKAMSLSYLIGCDQLATVVIKDSGQIGFKFGVGVVGEPTEPEYWWWSSIPMDLRNAIADQFELRNKEEEEKEVANQREKYKNIILNYVKERGISQKDGFYLPLNIPVRYRESPFTVKAGKFIPSDLIIGIRLEGPTLEKLSFDCQNIIDSEEHLVNEQQYIKFEEIKHIETLRYIIWIIENKK